ncbi:MAG: 2'-5' RNA ligase family protein [Microthrixaceae bacterium]
MTRLFVALRPPSEVLSAISTAVHPLAVDPPAGVRLTPVGQWHATLRFVGDADPTEVRNRLSPATLPACSAEVQPRPTVLGRVLAFDVAGVETLAEAVQAATASLGEQVEHRPFRGHVTVARLRRGVSPYGVRNLLAHGSIDLPEGPAEWPVGQIELVSSTVDSAGAVHEVLATFPTGDGIIPGPGLH